MPVTVAASVRVDHRDASMSRPAVGPTGRTVVLLGLEQLLEHSPELIVSPLAESPGDLVLEILDGGSAGFAEGFASGSGR